MLHRTDAASYHLGLIGHHRSGGRDNLRPGRFTDTHPAVQQLPHHVNAVVFESVVLLAKPVNHASNPAGHVDRLNVHLHQLAQLLSHRSRRLAQRERLGRIKVEEYSDEKNGEDHVELMLGVDAPRMFCCFQWERKYVGREMGVRDVADAMDHLFSQATVSRGRMCILSRDVDLVDPSDLAGSLMEQPKRDVFIKVFNRLVPVFFVETGTHQLPLLGMEFSVAAEHEVPSSLAHVQGSSFTPSHVELLPVFQNILGAHVRGQVDPRWNPGRLIPREILCPSKVSQDLSILAGDGHRIVDIN